MNSIRLSEKRLKTLAEEAGGNREVFLQLCRESIAGRWLKNHSIPSWRNPGTPGETGYRGYSLMIPDGSRIFVCDHPHACLSFDSLAASRCFGALSVELEKEQSGTVRGFVFLTELKPELKSEWYRFSRHGSSTVLLNRLTPSKHYLFTMLRFSIRLLILGEPDTPCPSVHGGLK